MSNPTFADGSVNPDGSNEPEIKEANVSSQPTLSDEELQLQKEQEKAKNLKKALEQATQETDKILNQLREKREGKKVLKNELDELDELDNKPSNKDSEIKQIVQDHLEELKQEPRRKGLSIFFNKYPEIVSDSELQTKLMQRYHQIKESNEMDTELIVRDLESAYFSLRGAEMLKTQMNNDFTSEQFSIGARYTGATQVGTSSTSGSNIDRATFKAVQDLSHLGMTVERARELKKKGYL